MKKSTLIQESEKVKSIIAAVEEANFRMEETYCILVPKHKVIFSKGMQLPEKEVERQAKERGDIEGYILAIPPKNNPMGLQSGDRVYMANAELNIIPVMGIEVCLMSSAYILAASNLKHLEDGSK